MHGRIKRRQADAAASGQLLPPPPVDAVCALCDRSIPASQRDAHHLVPKSRGGVQTTWLHRICHRQVHALFSEAELERDFASVDALRQHPDLARFIAWVRRKPDGFYERTRKSGRLRRR